ncbi:MAG: lysozyme inhibitor LprI family protein [Reyranellales bacterium]|jgi:uncharacterized protein YecT (DUF1311 family)
MKWTAMILALLLVSPVMAARAAGPDAAATNTIEDCIKTAASAGKPMSAAERCIGIVSNPCLDDNKTKSTADMNACVDRERAVWDDMLNETYRLLAAKLDADQKGKLRDMQRAWIASRDKTCGFYWDFYQGTMASPMASVCVNRETALRTLFLLSFLYDDK